MTEIQVNTKKIQAWLVEGITSENIVEAATLLLKITRNRILYDSIMRRGNIRLCEYNLGKVLKQRGIQSTADQREEEVKAAPIIRRLETEKVDSDDRMKSGMRADHDTLPSNVQQLYNDAVATYRQMRAVHEKCKLLTQPCDRSEYIHQLLKLEEEMRNNFTTYDNWNEREQVFVPAPPSIVDAKRINANRTFITKAKKRLPSVTDPIKAEELRKEIAARLKELIEAGSAVTDQLFDELKVMGVEC